MPLSGDETLENRTLLAAPKRIPPVGCSGACRSAEKRVTPFRGSFLQFIVSIHISGMIDRRGSRRLGWWRQQNFISGVFDYIGLQFTKKSRYIVENPRNQ
jgi:hypothetical protein